MVLAGLPHHGCYCPRSGAGISYVASQGQAIVSGTLPQPGTIRSEPFFIRLQLDDVPNEDLLKPGAVGTVAIYTESVAATHIIRKVMIRMEAILNYLNPAL